MLLPQPKLYEYGWGKGGVLGDDHADQGKGWKKDKHRRTELRHEINETLVFPLAPAAQPRGALGARGPRTKPATQLQGLIPERRSGTTALSVTDPREYERADVK